MAGRERSRSTKDDVHTCNASVGYPALEQCGLKPPVAHCRSGGGIGKIANAVLDEQGRGGGGLTIYACEVERPSRCPRQGLTLALNCAWSLSAMPQPTT